MREPTEAELDIERYCKAHNVQTTNRYRDVGWVRSKRKRREDCVTTQGVSWVERAYRTMHEVTVIWQGEDYDNFTRALAEIRLLSDGNITVCYFRPSHTV